MTIEKKVEAMEGEVKLMKGELKETLTNVRDFLLSLKLPPSPVEGLEMGETTRLAIDGGLSLAAASSAVQQSVKESVEVAGERPVTRQVEPDPPAVFSVTGVPPRAQFRGVVSSPQTVVDEPSSPGAEAPETARFVEVEGAPQSAASEPSEKQGQRKQFEEGEVVSFPQRKREEEIPEPVTEQAGGPTPQVNLLANLLRWVSVAAKEIGIGQLPTFLDVYGTTGNLSPEIRKVILRFAGVVEQMPSEARSASVLSELMSEQLATFLEVHSVNGHLSPEIKQSILHFASVIAEQASDARTAGVWNQLMSEQLATFLEMHSASGRLSPEVKEGVLRFIGTMASRPDESNEADMTPQSAERNVADVWSRLILELHGILSGGGTPLQLLVPFQDGAENEAGGESEVKEYSIEGPVRLEKDELVPPKEDKSGRLGEDKPVILKLVLPTTGGVEKEFSINLTTEAGGGDSLSQSSGAQGTG